MFQTEIDIIQGCIKHNIKAQEALFIKYGPEVKKVCFRYSRNGDDAHDIFQETFIKVFKDIHAFKNQCPLVGWIKRIAINTTLSFYRKKTKNNTFSLFETSNHNDEYNGSDSSLELNVSDEDSCEDMNNDYEEALSVLSYEQILDIVRSLDPPMNIIFNMFYIENYSHKEIAATLNIRENNCRTLLHRAKKKIKDEIKLHIRIKATLKML